MFERNANPEFLVHFPVFLTAERGIIKHFLQFSHAVLQASLRPEHAVVHSCLSALPNLLFELNFDPVSVGLGTCFFVVFLREHLDPLGVVRLPVFKFK